MLPLDRLTAFARHARWLAITLEALVLLSLLAGAIPLALAEPVWWLRLYPVLLLAVILLRLEVVLLDSESDDAEISGLCSFRLVRRWALIFALLVPLQLIGYAWLWADSDNQINRQISQGQSAVAELRSRILASGSQAELQTLLASANPGPLPPLKSSSLSDQKQQLSEAIAINTSQLSSKLREQRSAMLRSTLPGTMRVFFGAAIGSAFLFLLRSQI